jgi:hypothetical protein
VSTRTRSSEAASWTSGRSGPDRGSPQRCSPRRRRSGRSGRKRRRHGTLGAAAVLVVAAASVALLADRRTGDAESVTAGPVEGPGDANADLLAPGETRLMSPSPLGGRSTMAVVWTGFEMIIWGGERSDGHLDQGAGYDPRTDTWRPLAPGPLDARNAPAAVWTGEEVLLWGGHSPGVDHTDGAAYDPATDTWRRIADAPIDSAGRPSGIWTGTQMVVFAGFNSTEAAIYDPRRDAWERLASLPGQPMPPNPQFAFSGDTIYGRLMYPADPGEASMRSGVFAYDLAQDSWRELAPLDDGSRFSHLVWAGGELLAVSPGPDGRAARYDHDADTWIDIARWPEDAGEFEVHAWTGRALLLWGGGDDALLLDPVSGTWTTTPAGGIPPRVQPASVWADGVLLVWGGWSDRADGVVVRPGLRTAPSPPPPRPSAEISEQPVPGDPAVWWIDPDEPPSTTESTFTALVSRLGCNNGVTGEVLRPGVVLTDHEVIVTFTVEHDPDGGTCPGNDLVPYVVDLGEPLGNRDLVDGSCRAGGAAATTSHCAEDYEGSVRWRPSG